MDAFAPLEIRLRQLSRMLGRPLSSESEAIAAADSDTARLAAEFFAEAADSDDVTSGDAARSYLESRLSFFDGLISDPAANSIRVQFEERLRAWEG